MPTVKGYQGAFSKRATSQDWPNSATTRIRFADGATERRAPDSPAFSLNVRHFLEAPTGATVQVRHGKAHPFGVSGIGAYPLSVFRGGTALVWRVTSGKGEPLAGEWAKCSIKEAT